MAPGTTDNDIWHRLRQYHDTDVTARQLLDYFAGRQQGNIVKVDRLEQLKLDGNEKLPRGQIIRVLKQLAAWGLGEFRVGRRGHSSRFIWSASMSSIGEAAAGRETIAAHAEDGEEETRTLQHYFRLRPNYVVAIHLPINITSREATRLADFIKALPFETER